MTDLDADPAAPKGFAGTMEYAATLPDPGAEPGPESLPPLGDPADPAVRTSSASLDQVTFPEDGKAPDYAYLAGQPAPDRFELTGDVLASIAKLNHYDLKKTDGAVAFALRGAALEDGHEAVEATAVTMRNVRPDHRNFRCVVGIWWPERGRITAFTGSTVPCRLAIYRYANGGDLSNMLPTGAYTFYVWRHKSIRPALRMGLSAADPEAGAPATVLRNRNNLMLDTTDPFTPAVPYDNVHCSYYLEENPRLGASFSSWGCLTVRGADTPSHQWKSFQSILSGFGERSRVDLMLATGLDAALVQQAGGDDGLLKPVQEAIRHGSTGVVVARLQLRLGIGETGVFDHDLVDKWTGRQRSLFADAGEGRVADGIYSRRMDQITNWKLFDTPP